MVSAFDVYLVMQLDAIRTALAVAGLLSATSCFFAFMAADIERSEWAAKWAPRLLVVAGVTLLPLALIPSSKTAAAMILVPALTSPEVIAPVSAEARELFDLAKAALRNVAEREPEPAKE